MERVAGALEICRFERPMESQRRRRPQAGQARGEIGDGELTFAKDFVEELGATRLIHGGVGTATVAIAVAATASDLGSNLAADRETVHLFDPATGKSLRR